MVKMRAVEFGCAVAVLFALLIVGKADVYIVTIEGEPIISYKGDVDGFEATAVESDEKIDTTRYMQKISLEFFFIYFYIFYICKYIYT